MTIKLPKYTLLLMNFLSILQTCLYAHSPDANSNKTIVPMTAVNNVKDLKALYVAKCSTCHSISKSNNANDILPSDWKATIGGMASMKNSGISRTDQELIYDYLVYDSATRRKKKLDQQISALPAGQQECEKAKIVAVLKKYGLKN